MAGSKRKAIRQLTCNKPDRHCPELVCGFPLPCPWHTVIIDLEENPPTITVPATAPLNADKITKLKDVALILKDKD